MTRPNSHLGPLVAITAVLLDSINALHVIAAFQSIAFQELLLKLGFHFTFGNIKPPRHRRPKS